MTTPSATMRLTDCPRDAMQGIKTLIPTSRKTEYLNLLLQAGFDLLDFGSFVSAAAIPQMADTRQVADELITENTHTQLLAIAGNLRGAREAASIAKIDWIGFPFSVSDTFLKLNLHSNLAKAYADVCAIQNLCDQQGKKLMVYLSMGFGNPYNDPWHPELVAEWVERLHREGINHMNLSDTVGLSTVETVSDVFGLLSSEFTRLTLGFHLHTKPGEWRQKIDKAWEKGCRSFDGVLLNGGGCPMTGVDLVGNLPMQNLVDYCADNHIGNQLKTEPYALAREAALKLYNDIESQFK